MKVEVAALGSPSLISLMVYVAVKHHGRIIIIIKNCMRQKRSGSARELDKNDHHHSLHFDNGKISLISLA